jgi:hypothetical protein
VTLYDNERHILFLVPSLAILGSWVLSKVARRSGRHSVLATGVVLMAVLAGVSAIRQLHPYEYTYFNRFVGGLTGAQGRFDTDYWALSTRELLEQVPSTGTKGATVRVCMVVAAARIMAPPDSLWCQRPRRERTSRSAAPAGGSIGGGSPPRNSSPPPRVKTSSSAS